MIRENKTTGQVGYPELSDAENAEIRKARQAGYAAFFPSYPDALAQARNTLAGARQFNLLGHELGQSVSRGNG